MNDASMLKVKLPRPIWRTRLPFTLPCTMFRCKRPRSRKYVAKTCKSPVCVMTMTLEGKFGVVIRIRYERKYLGSVIRRGWWLEESVLVGGLFESNRGRHGWC